MAMLDFGIGSSILVNYNGLMRKGEIVNLLDIVGDHQLVEVVGKDFGNITIWVDCDGNQVGG